jgi:hypothetical protein
MSKEFWREVDQVCKRLLVRIQVKTENLDPSSIIFDLFKENIRSKFEHILDAIEKRLQKLYGPKTDFDFLISNLGESKSGQS